MVILSVYNYQDHTIELWLDKHLPNMAIMFGEWDYSEMEAQGCYPIYVGF